MHRQAITTRFISPTNHRGARIKAQAAAGSIILSWDYSLNATDNHKAAAMALAHKLGWHGTWFSGGMPDERGDVFVLADALEPEGEHMRALFARAKREGATITHEDW